MAEKFTIAVCDNAGLPKSGASVSLVGAATYSGTELGTSGKYFFNAINLGKYFLWVNGVNTGESFAVGEGEVAGLGYSDGKYIKSGTSALILDEIGIDDVSGLSSELSDKVDVLNGTLEGLVDARDATIENDQYVNKGDQEFNPSRIDITKGVLESVNGQGQYVKIRKARQEEDGIGEADIEITQTNGSYAIRIISNDETDTVTLNADDLKFNGVSIFTTFLSAVSATLQKAYDTGAEIITSVANGAVKLRRGTGADSDNVLEVQDGAGITTFAVRGNGVIINRSSLPMRAESLATTTDPRETRTEIRGLGVGATGVLQKFYNRFCANTDKGFDAGMVSSSTFGNDRKYRVVAWSHAQDASSTIDAPTNYFELDGNGNFFVSGALTTSAIKSIPLRINSTTVLSGNRQNITFYGSTASQTITIPLATGSGNMLRLSNVASVAVALSFTGSTYLGASTFVLRPNESLVLLDDESTKWVGYNAPSTTGYSVGDLRLIGLENTAIGQNSVTGERGHLVRMINGTGATSVKGNLVSASTTTDNQFVLQTNEFDAFGVVAQSGIASGQECWIWVNGSTCEVLWENGQSSTRGYLAICAPTDGRAKNVAVPDSNPTVGEHFKEIGHVLQSKVSGTNVMVLCQIHFN